ncbi:MAG: hypothetical protein JXX29_06825 [Deltaproteobacteria bacterium]|nr:hypothetical protein [Deltaproteobacteria bacterium]MBN2671366.1 hypothetical protein [Deltaproteobacteria bacterium]
MIKKMEQEACVSGGGGKTDTLNSNLREIKAQIAEYGSTLEKIVSELQTVPDGQAIDAFRTQVMHKQMYLENLIDETTCEIDLLKRDMASIAADLREVKDVLKKMQHANGADEMGFARRHTEPVPIVSESYIDNADKQAIAAIRRHPLSSIPPRQLSENEAMNFLRAIDEIVTKRRNSDLPIPASSTK